VQRLSIAALGVIALAVGALFTLQGLDVIGGSAMSGHSVWAVVGIVLILVGLGVLGLAAQQGRQRRP
jgi:uncharacterized membrane protein YidH (DUF202 family)